MRPGTVTRRGQGLSYAVLPGFPVAEMSGLCIFGLGEAMGILDRRCRFFNFSGSR